MLRKARETKLRLIQEANKRLLGEDYLTEFKTINVGDTTYEVDWEIIGDPKDGESGTAIGTGAKYSDDEGKFYKASIHINFHTIFDFVEEISKDEYDVYKNYQMSKEEKNPFLTKARSRR